MIPQRKDPYSVTEISVLVRKRLEEEFGHVSVEGEVTDYRGANSSGHRYFSLKDSSSRIAAVLFGGTRCPFELEAGMKVVAEGRLTAYAGTSRYQIIVRSLRKTSDAGELALKFEEMKRRLEKEGLFDPGKKRPVPRFPWRIGLVTSPTGAVVRDFVNVSSRRFGNLDILVYPARVQGAGAEKEIARGVEILSGVGTAGSPFSDLARRDIIVVMRGGGSMEELWCFNEEIVARAVRASSVPVISAVGHETDFTICDFAADLRAPTPSAAAEIAIVPKEDLLKTVSLAERRIRQRLDAALQDCRNRLAAARKNRVFSDPQYAVESYRQRTDFMESGLVLALEMRLKRYRERLLRIEAAFGVARAKAVPEMRSRIKNLEGRALFSLEKALQKAKDKMSALQRHLVLVSPASVLERGYTITTYEDGSPLKEADSPPEGTLIYTRVSLEKRIASSVAGGQSPKTKRGKGASAVKKSVPGQQGLFDF